MNKESNPLFHKDYPLSSKYDPQFVFRNQMGPNVLWLTEWLARDMDLRPGMKVLDLGCGKAISSIFLAKEFSVDVWATDLWIRPAENMIRIDGENLGSRIFPIRAEAHNLPYAEGFFDRIISIDSYHYFGTDQMYMGYIARYLKPGGRMGAAVPGLHHELKDGVPQHLKKPQRAGNIFWLWECITFHSAEWWQSLWTYYDFIKILNCEGMKNGGNLWLQWEKALEASSVEKLFPADTEALEADKNLNLTFVKIIAERNRRKIDFYAGD
jgi:SAM-dependent methyltransferase